MSGRLRVLNAIGNLDVGGAQLRVLDLHRHLDRESVQFDYLVVDEQVGQLEVEALELGGNIYRCPWDLRFPGAFLRLLRELRPDVVHGHMLYASGPIVMLARRAGVPVRVAHFRSTHDGKGPGRRRELKRSVLRSMIDRGATDIVGVSQDALEKSWIQFKGRDERCQVVYDGLDFKVLTSPARDRASVRGELGIEEEATTVIHLGRFHPAKNHVRLVEMFAEVHDRDPGAVLVLVGDGPPDRTEEVTGRVGDLGLESSVRIIGARSDIVDLLHAADVMVFPSLWEGLGNVVIEGRAAGLPVVASNLGSVVEIASYLGGVELLSLEESDRRWAEAILGAAEDRRSRPSSPDLISLSSSPFAMDRSIDQLMEIWTGSHAR